MTDQPSGSHQNDLFHFNGVDPSGAYLTDPLTPEQLLGLAQDEFHGISQEQQEAVKNLSDAKDSAHFAFDAPLEDLEEAGWGVVFHKDVSDDFRKQVEKLVKHRADKHSIEPKIFEVTGDTSYLDFLSKNGVSPGLGEVSKVPYYLMLVGNPQAISYRFQYELGTEYAVGRIEDTDPYKAYIDQLIDYETADSAPTARQVVFWATSNEDDESTPLSSKFLVQPLYDGFDPKITFDRQLYMADTAGKEASKTNLTQVLTQAKPPSLLFTASHGLGYRKPDPANQPRLQGALVTQEWVSGDPITPAQIFSGDDIAKGANVRGMVHFAFACFGAGTPRQDDFSHGRSDIAPVIAPFPFTSNLACQELSHGALAFVGHVDRAWGYSFLSESGESQILGFTRALKSMLRRGWPIGHSLRDLYDRALHLSKDLLEDLNELDAGKKIPALEIANKWKERNDARAYALVGDPAASLRVEDIA